MKGTEVEMLERLIWCDLHKGYYHVKECKPCLYRDNCQYREHGAMRRIKINWDNWFSGNKYKGINKGG